MNENETKESIWTTSVGRVGESLLGLTRNRLELFSVELQEEKLRVLNLLLRLVIALALVAAGVGIALGTLAVCAWAIGGYRGLIVVSAASLCIGLGLLLRIRSQIQSSPPPFSETIEQFRKDHACLRNDKSVS